jgi:hypothetical protein
MGNISEPDTISCFHMMDIFPDIFDDPCPFIP